MPVDRAELPYRPNVGICLINTRGLVWMGKTRTSGPEIVSLGYEWQMPQGGIEESEDIAVAARRELWEETGVTNIDLIGQTAEWWSYDFPEGYVPTGHKLDPYRGQRQKWVAFRFTGSDHEIDVSAKHTHEPQEFLSWEWMTIDQALSVAVRFKVKQYGRVFEEFRTLIQV